MAQVIQLPAGYEDAVPVSLKLPPGYEDARPVMEASQLHDLAGGWNRPGGSGAEDASLYERTSGRIKQNFDLGSQLKNMSDQVSEAIKDVKTRGLFPSGVHRLPEVLDTLKKTYSKPENILGDLISGFIAHQASTSPEAAATPAQAEPPAEPAPKTGISQENLESIRQGGAEMRRSNAQFVQDVIKRQGLPPATPEMAAEEAARKGGDIARAQKYPVKPTGMVRDPFATAEPASAPGNSVPEAYPGEGASIKSGLGRAEANQPLKQRISDLIDQHIPKESLSNTQAKAELEKLLSDAMGGQTLEKGVPLRNQTAAGGVAAEAPASALPVGFTPVESSAIKGYKYNPAAKEFEVISTNGRHYIHGDVTPEQEEAFETADSKGKAWNELRSNSVLVGKVLAGKRISIKPTVQSASPEQ